MKKLLVLLICVLVLSGCKSETVQIPEKTYNVANEYMNMAIDEAGDGIYNRHGGPFGSVIVKDGKVIGQGHGSCE